MKRLQTLALLFSSILPLFAQPRQVTNINRGWEFSRDANFTTTENIDIPHDFQISQPWVPPAADEKADNTDVAANIKSRLSARGFKEMGQGYYRRTITPDASLKGRRVLLDFEGIMLVGDVYLNGQLDKTSGVRYNEITKGRCAMRSAQRTARRSLYDERRQFALVHRWWLVPRCHAGHDTCRPLF